MRREESPRNPEELMERLEKLEKHQVENTITLVEFLSNITFFGGLKMKDCEHAREGQCSSYFVEDDFEKKIPLIARCRIKDCRGRPGHCHLEISNMTCAFCPEWYSKREEK